MPLLDAMLFSSVSCRGCQQEPPPATSRHDLALEPLRARLRSVTPHVFALGPTSLPFARRPLRCDGGVSDPNARSRRRPTERAGRHLEPRTAKRLLQLHTTHARVHERTIFALAMGVPTNEFPRAASLRPLVRGGEPCVPDRLEDRTPISCEWAEKEHTDRRAESKVAGHAPESRFLGAFSAQRSRRSEFCVRSGVSQSLPLSLSEHPLVVSAVSDAELECPSEFREAQAVARICVHVFHRTNHLPDPFESREA
jgi:hypothetical protein